MTAMEPPAGLEPVVQESTPSLIARTLRRAISDGSLGPGEQLGEAALAQSLGVSRGPLREAMQRLTQEGLLISHRNRGLFVADLTPEAVEDMYLLRTTVETAALDRVLDLGLGDPTADALDAAVDAMADLADEPMSESMVAADLDFHHTLVEAARSPRLSRVHETVLVETSMCLHAMRGTYTDARSPSTGRSPTPCGRPTPTRPGPCWSSTCATGSPACSAAQAPQAPERLRRRPPVPLAPSGPSRRAIRPSDSQLRGEAGARIDIRGADRGVPPPGPVSAPGSPSVWSPRTPRCPRARPRDPGRTA